MNPVQTTAAFLLRCLLLFAIEAALNHIGKAELSNWEDEERKLSWREKLDRIKQQFQVEVDFGKRPFQTVAELFTFRDALAHGKTTSWDARYNFNEKSDENGILDPDWLKKYWANEAGERVLAEIKQVIYLLHEKAGFERFEVAVIGIGEFEEQSHRNRRFLLALPH